jgi:integrase
MRLRNCAYNAHYKNSHGQIMRKSSMKSRSRARAPTPVKRTVPPGRLPNAQYRTREYLTEREVERLMKAAGNNRHGHRDATMILTAFRHGLRASELSSLRWDQVDLVHGRLHVNRLKNGIPSVHPLTGPRTSRPASSPARTTARKICLYERTRRADVGKSGCNFCLRSGAAILA